jgi:hypothetical protein
MIETLTLDEIETLENIIGLSIEEAFGDGKPKGKALKTIIWIMQRRTNPDYSIEDAGKLSFQESMNLLGEVAQKKG